MIIRDVMTILYHQFVLKIIPSLKKPVKWLQNISLTQSTSRGEMKFTARIYEIVLNPLYWFVDNYIAKLGGFFVAVVLILLIFFILLAYLIGLPYWLNRNIYVAIIALTLGNYILINVAFHYYMALTTPPGNPPMNHSVQQVISICKKCGSPKPPRTHHCSVCQKCILKMDHHCPWLNNCIGHNNHRFFFMFCAYTWIGTVFIMIFGAIIAYEHFILDLMVVKDPFEDNYYPEINKNIPIYTLKLIQYYVYKWQNWLIQCELTLCIGAFLSVGALAYWHIKLITRGETCVESFIEMKQRQEKHGLEEPRSNPFDNGPRCNWINFLGLNKPGISWKNILLPSTHSPKGSALFWNAEK